MLSSTGTRIVARNYYIGVVEAEKGNEKGPEDEKKTTAIIFSFNIKKTEIQCRTW